ncbi:hypothetical protein B9Z55_006083 [Caenorhabditis nigoni]|uniref:Uncharacterized protein n=1 Tax=Caenorhabditis nigoni TaxID=1611254 RepID=A0A2G5V3L9_9PELO|nr:hypothetical protein B9Z55_006083 [Caenorhabditis nigoni]
MSTSKVPEWLNRLFGIFLVGGGGDGNDGRRQIHNCQTLPRMQNYGHQEENSHTKPLMAIVQCLIPTTNSVATEACVKTISFVQWKHVLGGLV